MRSIYLAVLSIFPALISAQSPIIQWQHTIGANANEFVESIAETSDGGLIICGNSNSVATGDKTEDTYLYWDYWIVKLDYWGDLEWESTIGGSYYDISQAMAVSTDGAYYLAGTSYSDMSGDKSEHSKGGADYWIVKIQEDGTILWNKTIGASQNDECTTISATADGGCIVGGYTTSGISGNKTEASKGGFDYWMVKLDASGNVEWDESIGTSAYDYMRTIVQTSDGGYFVAGSTDGGISGDKTEAAVGGVDYWVLKLSSTGDILWQNTIGSSSSDLLFSAIQTTDGGYLLGGHGTGGPSGDKTTTPVGSYDYWIVKLDSNGVVQWDKSMGGVLSETIINVQQSTDGGYLLAGSSESPLSGQKTQPSYGLLDYWLVKTNSDGVIEWDITLGGDNDDEMRWAYQASDGTYMVSGHSYSDIAGIKTESSNGLNDYWVLRLSVETPCASPPDGLFANAITATSAKLNWDNDPDALKYKVQYRKSTEIAWINTNATTNVKNIFTLEPNTTYKFRVKSLCGLGVASDFSEVATFTTSSAKMVGNSSDDFWVGLYPNPNRGEINIQINNNIIEAANIRVFDLVGNVVYADQIPVGHAQIQLPEHLANGLYTFEVTCNQQQLIQQLVVIR
jgi:hypothetical protein